MTARLARLAGLPVFVCVAGFLAVATTGCPGSSSSGGFVGVTTSGSLVITGGNNQTGVAGTALSTPLMVTLVNGSGSPLSNQPVTFAASQGGGSVSATTVSTNVLGQATTTLTLGAKPGTNTVLATATVAGITSGSLSATFTETGTAGAAASVAQASGGTQSITVNTTSAPFVVTVTDVAGNPVAGALVVFNVTSGTGTLGTPTAVTNASGQAQTTITPTSTGTVTVVGTVANATGSSTTFSITVTPAAPPAANPAIAFKVPGTTQIAGGVVLTASANVTGIGTTFTTSVVVGSQIFFASQPGTTYKVASITDDTHLVLSATYTGSVTIAPGVSLTILGFSEPRGIAVSQTTNALWITAVYNGTIAGVDSPSVVLKTTKTGGLTANTPPIASPAIPGTANLIEPIALALSHDEDTLFVLDMAATTSNGPTGLDTTTGTIYTVGANGGPLVLQTGGFGLGIGLGSMDAPTAMAISPDGQRLYITGHDFGSHMPAIYSVDVNSNAGGLLFSFSPSGVGGTLVEPTGIGVSLDGKTLYVTDSGAGSGGNAQLFSLSSSGGVSSLSALGTISDTTRTGGGVVPGFDGGVNFVAYSGALGKISSIPPTGGSETLRTSSTGSGPFVQPMQSARDGTNIYTVDSEATGSGCVVVSQ